MDRNDFMHELQDTRLGQNVKGAEMALAGEGIDLRSELEQTNRIIDALCYSYYDVYYANMSTGEMRSYRYSRDTRDLFGDQFENGSFETNFYTYVRSVVHPDDQKLFEPILTIASVRKTFSRQMTYGFSYRVIWDEEIHYCQVEVVKILNSKDEFVFAFKSIDKQHQLEQNAREKELNTVQAMVQHLMSVVRSPLENIISVSQRAKNGLLTAQEMQESFGKINEEGRMLLEFAEVICSKENVDRDMIERAIMQFKSAE